jgi:hypothetical protein
MNAPSSNLIYGLIDPRTRLIRYVGLSSRGMRRPKEHRLRSCPDTYCRRWIRQLHALGLDYEVAVLEVLASAVQLDEAERWWIAFGRACGWPLTNVTDGGGLSEAAIIEKRQRTQRRKTKQAAWLKAEWKIGQDERRLNLYSRLFTSAEFERCEVEMKQAMDASTTKVATLMAEIEGRCFELFEKYIGDEMLLVRVATETAVTLDTAKLLYQKWLRFSYKRARLALAKEREALCQHFSNRRER